MALRSIHDLSAEEIEQFRVDYPANVIPVRDLADRLGISMNGLYALVAHLGLERRQAVARKARAESVLAAFPVPRDAPADLGAAARGLERQLVEQLLDLQRRAGRASAADAQALSKAIAHHARALRSIRDWTHSLHEDKPDDDGAPPRDLAELRDELRRHLERIRAEERGSPGLPGGPGPG